MLLLPINSIDIHPVTVVVISRLVYRKGMDLLVAIIPRICAMHRNVRFIIGLEIRSPPHPGDMAQWLILQLWLGWLHFH